MKIKTVYLKIYIMSTCEQQDILSVINIFSVRFIKHTSCWFKMHLRMYAAFIILHLQRKYAKRRAIEYGI